MSLQVPPWTLPIFGPASCCLPADLDLPPVGGPPGWSSPWVYSIRVGHEPPTALPVRSGVCSRSRCGGGPHYSFCGPSLAFSDRVVEVHEPVRVQASLRNLPFRLSINAFGGLAGSAEVECHNASKRPPQHVLRKRTANWRKPMCATAAAAFTSCCKGRAGH